MQDKFTTDGATLPLFFRGWIERNYDSEIINLIDRGGRYHDWLAWKYPNTPTHNRRRFIRLLRRYGVPSELRRIINLGLWIYDHSPKWLQVILQQTT